MSSPAYEEFEHELLHTNWNARLKHVDLETLERAKRSRSPHLSPLKAELLSFDRTQLRNPLYKSRWSCQVSAANSSTVTDPSSRLLIIGEQHEDPTISVELQSIGHFSAHAYATTLQKSVKTTQVQADVLIVDDESDDATVRVKSSEDEGVEFRERRLTENFLDVNDLELGIKSLQLEMGLLMQPLPKIMKVVEQARKHSVIMPSDPLLEKRTVVKHPKVNWAVKEQAKEYVIQKTTNMEDIFRHAVEDMLELTRVQQVAVKEPMMDVELVDKIQRFEVKSKVVKKGKKLKTSVLMGKVRDRCYVELFEMGSELLINCFLMWSCVE